MEILFFMAKDPAFLFYSSDFLTGTMFMTDDQVGKYIRLLCAQHQHGGRISKLDFNDIVGSDAKLRAKFLEDEAGFYSERLDNEMTKRQRTTDSYRENGKLGGRPPKPKENQTVTNSLPNHNRSENENENENVNEDVNVNENENEILELMPTFQNFWDEYGKKIDRPKCEKKWAKLKQVEKEACMAYLPAYKESTPDLKFRRNPETFLNNKTWENEIIKPKTNQPNRHLTAEYLADLERRIRS